MFSPEKQRHFNRRHHELDLFLEARGYELVSRKFPEGVVFVVVPTHDRVVFSRHFPNPLFRKLLKFQRDKVFYKEGHNVGRGDCFDIAVKAHTELFPEKSKNMESGTIHISKDARTNLPLFADLGFKSHVVNFIKLQTNKFLAYDLTAHYNFFGENTDNMIFCILGRNTEELQDVLRKLYGLKK